jgi:[lysine-biosynthesis-protein LysW]--L-2-aminoadipate ligase
VSQRRIGMVCSRVRMEEKLLLEAFARHPDVAVVRVDGDQFQGPLAGPSQRTSGCAASLRRGVAALLELRAPGHRGQGARGLATVNRAAVLETTGDKLRTTLALVAAGIPTPPARVAFKVEAGLEAVGAPGYPCVVKSVTGSWGRLVARLNDRDASEAVLEHKALLGGALHRVLYLPAHVDKPGRDLRAFVVGDRTVAVIGRRSPHWVTNTARGAVAEAVEVTPQLGDPAAALVPGDRRALWVGSGGARVPGTTALPAGAELPGAPPLPTRPDRRRAWGGALAGAGG